MSCQYRTALLFSLKQHQVTFALGVPLQLGNSIVFYYCRKICHGYTRGYTCICWQADTPELCRRSSHVLGRLPALRVKCIHPRYSGIYFSMSYEYNFMGFIFFSNANRSCSSRLQASVIIVAYWLLFYRMLIQFNVCVVGNSHISSIL